MPGGGRVAGVQVAVLAVTGAFAPDLSPVMKVTVPVAGWPGRPGQERQVLAEGHGPRWPRSSLSRSYPFGDRLDRHGPRGDRLVPAGVGDQVGQGVRARRGGVDRTRHLDPVGEVALRVVGRADAVHRVEHLTLGEGGARGDRDARRGDVGAADGGDEDAAELVDGADLLARGVLAGRGPGVDLALGEPRPGRRSPARPERAVTVPITSAGSSLGVTRVRPSVAKLGRPRRQVDGEDQAVLGAVVALAVVVLRGTEVVELLGE